MEHYNITLTTEDRRILNSYCTVATGMAEFWGENCEIIIHNLERLDASVMTVSYTHLIHYAYYRKIKKCLFTGCHWAGSALSGKRSRNKYPQTDAFD